MGGRNFFESSMPVWIQHILVLTLVAGCIVYTAWQGWRSLNGKRSKLGSCCAKGCEGMRKEAQSAEQAGRRIVFLPVEMLRKRK